jgi:SAM-dependent methyltransferase
MEKKEYEKMYEVEDNNWWYAGLRRLTRAVMDNIACENDGLAVLDAGCGTGGMLKECGDYSAFGMDISEESMKFCRMRSLENLLRGSVDRIPFKDSVFNIVISLDVLCNMNVQDDFKTLEELYRVIDTNGVLLINLPAYNFLRSRHDESFHQVHRYTARDLREKVRKAGFTVERITYRNTFLFPLMAVVRIVNRLLRSDFEKKESDMRPLPGILNKFLQHVLILENRMIAGGASFPFGLSVFCVARKKEK